MLSRLVPDSKDPIYIDKDVLENIFNILEVILNKENDKDEEVNHLLYYLIDHMTVEDILYILNKLKESNIIKINKLFNFLNSKILNNILTKILTLPATVPATTDNLTINNLFENLNSYGLKNVFKNIDDSIITRIFDVLDKDTINTIIKNMEDFDIRYLPKSLSTTLKIILSCMNKPELLKKFITNFTYLPQIVYGSSPEDLNKLKNILTQLNLVKLYNILIDYKKINDKFLGSQRTQYDIYDKDDANGHINKQFNEFKSTEFS